MFINAFQQRIVDWVTTRPKILTAQRGQVDLVLVTYSNQSKVLSGRVISVRWRFQVLVVFLEHNAVLTHSNVNPIQSRHVWAPLLVGPLKKTIRLYANHIS